MKLIKNLFTDTFLNKKIRMISTCEIAPVDITGTVMKIGKQKNEILFYIKSDTNGKIYTVGSNSPNLSYDFIM